MDLKEIISRLTVVHRNSPVGIEHENFYTPGSTHGVINELVERINAIQKNLDTLKEMFGSRIPEDLDWLEKDIKTLRLPERLELDLKISIGRLMDVKVKDVIQTSPEELFRNNMISKQDVKIIREALYRIGIKEW